MTPQPILLVKKPTKTGESPFISFMMHGNSSVIGAKAVAIIRLYIKIPTISKQWAIVNKQLLK